MIRQANYQVPAATQPPLPVGPQKRVIVPVESRPIVNVWTVPPVPPLVAEDDAATQYLSRPGAPEPQDAAAVAEPAVATSPVAIVAEEPHLPVEI